MKRASGRGWSWFWSQALHPSQTRYTICSEMISHMFCFCFAAVLKHNDNTHAHTSLTENALDICSIRMVVSLSYMKLYMTLFSVIWHLHSRFLGFRIYARVYSYSRIYIYMVIYCLILQITLRFSLTFGSGDQPSQEVIVDRNMTLQACLTHIINIAQLQGKTDFKSSTVESHL